MWPPLLLLPRPFVGLAGGRPFVGDLGEAWLLRPDDEVVRSVAAVERVRAEEMPSSLEWSPLIKSLVPRLLILPPPPLGARAPPPPPDSSLPAVDGGLLARLPPPFRFVGLVISPPGVAVPPSE